MSDNRETRLLMISPKSMLTPDQLVRTIHAMNRDVRMKEIGRASCRERV